MIVTLIKRYSLLLLLTSVQAQAYSQHTKAKDTTVLKLLGGKQSELHATISVAPKDRAADSLEAVLKTENNDTNKAKTLALLCQHFGNAMMLDSALLYGMEANTLIDKLSFKRYSGGILHLIGLTYSYKGDNKEDLKYELRSLEAYRQLKFRWGEREVLVSMGDVYTNLGAYDKALSSFFAALKIALELNDDTGICDSYIGIGMAYSYLSVMDSSLDYYFKALTVAEKMKSKEQLSIIIANIGETYSDLKNYKQAIIYNKQALDTLTKWGYKSRIDNLYTNIASYYDEQGNHDTALQYELKAIQTAKEMGHEGMLSTSLLGLGAIYGNMGKNAQALLYSTKALQIVRPYGDKNIIESAYLNLGSIYASLKDYKKAALFLDSSLALSKSMKDKGDIMSTYGILAGLDSALGNYKKVFEDYKLYNAYKDSLSTEAGLQKITQLEMTRRFEKQQDSVKAEEAKAYVIREAQLKKKRIITYSIYVILLLIILLVIVLLNRQRIKRKNDKLLFEKERQHIELELANARLLLDEYIKQMIEKNYMLEQSRTNIEELKKGLDEKHVDSIDHLNNATILTQEDWDKFKRLFEHAHAGFLNRLKEKLPQLTNAEVRLVCLSKLQLGNKQMAGVLGVSYSTIKKTRYRLRKKLNLSEADSIDDIVEAV